MPRFIAFLRAVNVGGRNVAMADMRAHFSAIGLSKVETFIASGNVIFESRAAGEEALRRRIENRLAESLGWDVATFLRTDSEVAAIAACRPFTGTQMESAAALNVIFLAEPAPAEAVAKFRTDIDDFHVQGREIYWLCHRKQSESTFSNNVLERALKLRATFRGMNTLQKLAAKYPPQK